MTKLTEKTDETITKELADARKSLSDFRFEMAGGKIKNVKKGRTLRKEIARMMTEANRRRG